MRKRVALLYGKDEVFDNPLAIEYLKVYCSQDQDLCSTVDFEVFTFERDEGPTEVAQRILDSTPSVVGASCYVWNTDRTLEVCEHLKRANPLIFIVLGGPEVGHVSEEVCNLNPYVDVVVSGEGEETFRQLLRAYLSGAPLSLISGTTRRDSSEVIKEKGRPPLELNALPVLFHGPTEDYISSLKGKVLYETLRGCSHVCFFCDWGVMSRGQVRYFPIERIRDELDFILSHDGVRHLYITDSEINIDDEHAKNVLRTINALKRKYRWNGAVTFHLEASKEIDSELAELICEATSGIGIGVQSFNESALFQMGRRWFNREKFEENIERLEQHIRFVFQFIYGCPGDTYESFRDSLLWAVDRGRDVWFDRLRVLPGTIYRHRSERFDLKFDPKRPNHVISTNTFPSVDMTRSDSLKRGFLLYTFREFIHLNVLREYLVMDTMELLESFGQWCSTHVPDLSLAFSRADPPNLPYDFMETLATWIGAFVHSVRPVDWADYFALKGIIEGQLSARLDPRKMQPSYASVRGN